MGAQPYLKIPENFQDFISNDELFYFGNNFGSQEGSKFQWYNTGKGELWAGGKQSIMHKGLGYGFGATNA